MYHAFLVTHTPRAINKALKNNCQRVYLTRTAGGDGQRVTHVHFHKAKLRINTAVGWLVVEPGDVLESK